MPYNVRMLTDNIENARIFEMTSFHSQRCWRKLGLRNARLPPSARCNFVAFGSGDAMTKRCLWTRASCVGNHQISFRPYKVVFKGRGYEIGDIEENYGRYVSGGGRFL